MKKSMISNQKGLSLIELVVVVAILGILATLSYGPVTRQINKSKQAEAKANLGALNQTEKMYNIEYQGYNSDLKLLGAVPEGRLRYDMGFSGNAAAGSIGTYGGGAPTGNATIKAACTATPSLCTGITAMPEYTAADAIASATVSSSTAYTAQARSMLIGVADVWTINEVGNLVNTAPNF